MPDRGFQPDPIKRAQEKKARDTRLKEGPPVERPAAEIVQPQSITTLLTPTASSPLVYEKSAEADWISYHEKLPQIPKPLRSSAQRKMIIALVSQAFGASPDIVVRASNDRTDALSRQVIFLFMKLIQPEMTLPQIGNIMRRDHTSVLSGLRSIKNKIRKDKDLGEKVARLAEKFNVEEQLRLFLETTVANLPTTIKD